MTAEHLVLSWLRAESSACQINALCSVVPVLTVVAGSRGGQVLLAPGSEVEPAVNHVARWILTILSGSFQSLVWLYAR